MVKFICGKHSLLEAIENNIPFKFIYLTKKPTEALLAKQNYQIVPMSFLNQLTTSNHQGYVGQIEPIRFYPLEVLQKEQPNYLLILDHIQDPYNLGAIIRSANAMGVKHIILPNKRASKITEVSLKVSSGGFVGIKFIEVNSLSTAIEKLKKWGFWVYASALDKSSLEIDSVNLNTPAAIIVGSESKGVSKTILKQADEIFYIPMFGSVQSLNVSVATGIILFNLLKKVR
ncbi:rRNA methylase [Mesomycoplasma conjunctivae]|uniref:tRNA/rRNA methyltransferase n=1 Tax=Mesomycoplasma conjunctivae (strain ATCC 25834 / NCTC 10147 / HRC/581) TaxID=572263 RepID=C5J5X7_MESCH|nr:23S rRNA (guanosine(2251)-2'-O)-methyltransferase RlmB [Mesomycoplasma conjunctivae]CAT04869.1 TRNA/rRNA methyltransferase [Mesomycoplasma conjunctivae]VEU65948.1 rRNA methylase [Mesomycoplasma conjunctivae]